MPWSMGDRPTQDIYEDPFKLAKQNQDNQVYMQGQDLMSRAPNVLGNVGHGSRGVFETGFGPDFQARANDWQLRNQGLADSQIASAPAMAAEKFSERKFDTVWPWLQGQFGTLSGQLATAGGASGQGPHISTGGVWNPQQVQQQVNATRAQNDRSMNTQNQKATNEVAGRGFGSSSPLLQAIYGQNFAANLGTNTQAEQQLRTTAAQQNAEHTLGTQQASEQQFSNRQQEDIARRKPYWQTYNTLLQSLAGMA